VSASIREREGIEPSLSPAIHPHPQGNEAFWRISSKKRGIRPVRFLQSPYQLLNLMT
jgi:hypothetical protein